MKKIFLIVTALLVGFLIYSCSCLTCGSKEEANVPLDVLEKADSFIVSKTGEHFFNNYIAIDFFRTKHTVTTKWFTSCTSRKNPTLMHL